MDQRITISISQDLENITEQIRQFVQKRYDIESTDNGITVNVKGSLDVDFVEQKLVFVLTPL